MRTSTTNGNRMDGTTMVIFKTTTTPDWLGKLVQAIGNAARILRFDLNIDNGRIRVIFGVPRAEVDLFETRIGRANVQRVKNPPGAPQTGRYQQLSVTACKSGLWFAAVTGDLADNPFAPNQLDAIFAATFRDGVITGDPANQTEALYEGTSGQIARALVARGAGTGAARWTQITDSEENVNFALTDQIIAYGYTDTRSLMAVSITALANALTNADTTGDPDVSWQESEHILPGDLIAFSRSVGNTALATLKTGEGILTVVPVQFTVDKDGLPQIEVRSSDTISGGAGDPTQNIVLGVTGAQGHTGTIAVLNPNYTLGLRAAGNIPANVVDLARRSAGLQIATQ